MGVAHFTSALLASSSLLGAVSGAVLDLPVRIQDGYQMVQFGVGSPAQKINLLFDTGSASAWTVDSTCAKECRHVNKDRTGYNITASSTGKLTGESADIDYLGGRVVGPTVEDRFSAGKMTWTSKFIAANESSWSALAANGFMGLAFSSIEDGGATPIFESLMEQKLMDQPRFGIYYSKTDGDDTKGKPGKGLLTLGGSKEKKYAKGNLETIKLTTGTNGQYDVWRSVIHSTIGSTKDNKSATGKNIEKVDLSSASVVFDTGASGLSFPKNKIEEIYESIGMNWTAIINGQHIPLCSEFTKDWSLSLEVGWYGETKFLNVTGDQLAVPGFANRDDACWPPFDDDSSTGFVLIGTRFLKNFYTIWDYGAFPEKGKLLNPTLSFGYLKNGC